MAFNANVVFLWSMHSICIKIWLTKTEVNEVHIFLETTYFFQPVTRPEIVCRNNVVWFDVEMEKTRVMNFLEGLCYLNSYLQDALDTEYIVRNPRI